jgi:hypothetical protein
MKRSGASDLEGKMRDLNGQFKSCKRTSIDLEGKKQHQPKRFTCTIEDYNGDLADEMAAAPALKGRFAELPEVAAEDFEKLYSWFIS